MAADPPKGVIRWDPATATYAVDDDKAKEVLRRQAGDAKAKVASEERIRTIDQLRRWGVGYQEACLVTSDADFEKTLAVGFADEFLAGRGVGLSDADPDEIGEPHRDAGGRKKTIAVFAGPKGVGKTTTAAYVLWQGRPVRLTGPWTAHEHPLFIHAEALLAASRLTGNADAQQRAAFRRCRILVIDDLGLEKDPRHTMQTYLDGLVNARYSGDGWLVITTNLPPPDFRRRYGERIYDRLRQRACWYEIAHESLRGTP
jgi:hypothetical protein